MRFYKKPPAFTKKINKKAMDILPYAILVHSLLAIFIYGCPDIYAEKPDLTTKEIAGTLTEVYSSTTLTLGRRVKIDIY